jgi:putative RecB family exonuclease
MPTLERLSPSALSRYLTCPKQFYLADIERAPRENEASPILMQGNAIHAALDKFYGLADQHRSSENLERALRHVWTDPQIRKPGTFASREQEAGCGRAAIAMLDTYARDFDLSVRPLAREQWIKTKLSNGIVLFGKADRIDRGLDGGIRVIDYKTGRERLDVEDLHRDIACQVYALAAQDTYKRPVERVSLIYLQTGNEISWAPEQEDLDAARDRLEALATEIITSETFEATPGDQCRFCPYQLACSERQHVDLEALQPVENLPF